MITSTRIKKTEHYKGLDGVRKIFMTKKVTIREINLGYHMSRLTSFENWLKVSSPREDIKEVVKELIENV